MSDENHGMELQVGNVTVGIYNVEGKFVGLSLTEKSGPMQMRRVAVELHDIDQLCDLRDFLISQTQRMAIKAALKGAVGE